MAPRSAHLLVAWSGADANAVRALVAAGRLPVLAARLAATDRLHPLQASPATPYALAISLVTGVGPADHGLFAAVQPSSDGRVWLPVQAAHLPAPPLWDRVAAAGLDSAAIGWPGTHGAAARARRSLASDLDLAAADTALRPLVPLPGGAGDETLRLTPDQLDPGLLGFFIPRAELPASPATDPVVAALRLHLARIYSAHNSAVALLQSDTPPALLAVHYELPFFPAAALRQHPRLREAALRLLDLLLGDLLQQAPGAALTLAGLVPGNSFLVAPSARPPAELTAVASAVLGDCGVSPDQAVVPAASAPVDAAILLRRCHALGLAPEGMLAGPPTAGDGRRYDVARGHLLLAAHRPAEALPLLAAAWFHHPEDVSRALPLYECLHLLGLRAEARAPAGAMRDHARTGPFARLVEAELVLHQLQQPARALPLLAALRDDPQFGARAAPLYREALLMLRRFPEVRPLLAAAIADGSATPETHFGLAFACLHLGEITSAEAAARTAIELGDRRPHPRLVLELIAARRERRPAPVELPDWEVLMEQAARRDDHRRAYAGLRTDFLAGRAARRARQAPAAFKDGSPAVPADATWTIVTGLPRAGLSLLLRMLAFGGHPVMTDGRRPPDVHNPLGYFEWAPAARLQQSPRLLDEAANHALKLPAEALGHLPRDRRYRVLFVTRDAGETARSQAAVLGVPPPAAEAVAGLARRAAERLAAARAESAFEVLEVPFAELRRQPAEWAARLAAFLGPDRLRRPAAMADAIHPDLPRYRRP